MIAVFDIFGDLDGEDLGNFADALRRLGDARAEEEPRTGAHKLRVLQEAEEDRGRIVGADVFRRHDALQHGRLLDASDVDGGLETGVNAGRMKQNYDRGLEVKCGLGLEIGSSQNHSFADVGNLYVESQ